MKKLALIFSLAFFAFVVSASAQSSASTDKQTTEQAPATDKAKSEDDWSKGCGAFSGSKSAKAKCCAKPKSMAKKTSETTPSSNSEAVVSERKAVAEAESK